MNSSVRTYRRSVGLAAGKSQILGHNAINIDGIKGGLLQSIGKGNDLGGLVKLTSLGNTTGPGKDRSNGVGRGLLTLLVLSVMTGDGSVGSLGLKGLSIRGDQDGGHETKGTETLSNNIRLNITIVVLHGNDVTTLGLDHLGDHIIDESVLVPDALQHQTGPCKRVS